MTITPEAYAHLSTDKKTFTFYFDTLRAERDGTTWEVVNPQSRYVYACPIWHRTTQSFYDVVTKVRFDASFQDFRPTVTTSWFYLFSALTTIEGLEHLNTSQVMGMSRMFEGCSSLTSLDLSHFDTSQVEDMSRMFEGCSSLTSLDLSHFDTSQVEDMGGMFDGCSSLTSLDLSHFDTSQVDRMMNMFCGCSSLTSLDVSHFDTSQVEDMGHMFEGCSSLTSLDLSHFDTSEVKYMSSMFRACTSLITLDLSHVDFSAVNKMDFMLASCTQLQSIAVGDFTVCNAVSINECFSHCPALTTITCGSGSVFSALKRWIDHSALLSDAVNYEALEHQLRNSAPGVSVTISLRSPLVPILEAYVLQEEDGRTLRFYYDKKRFLHTAPSWNISECLGRAGWNDTKEPITKVVFDASFQEFRPTTTERWFFCLSHLECIEGIAYLNTSQVKCMSDMFFNCRALASLDLSHFDTSQVRSMKSMFRLCRSLVTLDISGFNTEQMKEMDGMFYGCSSLTTIYGDSAWHSKCSDEMFADCTSLRGAVSYDESQTDVTMANPETGYFTSRR